MTEEMKAQGPTPSASPAFFGKRVFNAMWYGALMGMVFSWPGVDLTFKGFSPGPMVGGLLGLVFLFGLPAGILLGFLDRRKVGKAGWTAVIKVPAMLMGGSLLLFGVLAIPILIDVLARSGSEWLTGGVGNNRLRQVIGASVGSCFGLLFLAILMANESIEARRLEPRLDSQKRP